jgi:Putative beta barrel porin-7 (BBP7)
MWKKLCAAVTGLGLTAGEVGAADPDPSFPTSWVNPADKPAAQQPSTTGSRLLHAFRWTRPTPTGGPSSLEEEGFRGSVFETRTYPPSNQGVVPAGGQLLNIPDVAAPISSPSSPPAILPTPPIPGSKVGGKSAAGALVLVDGSVLVPSGTTPEGEPIYERMPPGSMKLPALVKPGWRVWGSAEALLGMTGRANVPPLVTTGPASAGFGTAGAIGQPGTVPLFGGQGMLDDWRAGVRVELGAWLDNSRFWSVDTRFYSLYSTSDQLVGGGTGTNVVNLPQFVTVGGTTVQFPIYVGFPGVTAGSVSTTAQTSFAGGDLSLRHVLMQNSAARIDLLFGYRQLHLGDDLGDSFTVNSATPLATNPSLIGSDSIRSRNNFYGGQFGGVASYTWKVFSIEGLAAVALGVNVSDVDFDQFRQATIVGVPIPLVQSSSQDRTTYFGVAAEGGLKTGVQLTRNVKLTFGYTFIFWNDVRRAQEQYTLSPTLTGNTTSFYSHMLSWGAEIRF